MKGLISMAVLALATASVAAQETKLGAGVTLAEATPIASLVDHPDRYVGKTVRVDGVGTAVCEMMGCWIAIAADASKDAKTIRVKVEDGAITIPITAKGKRISAEGVFELAGDEHAKEAAAEHAKQMTQAKPATQHAGEHQHGAEHTPDAAKVYQIKGTGLVIR
jgi:hypothetical protein